MLRDKGMTLKKYIVTGSAGFIGYHLTLKLLSEGHTVLGIDIFNDYYDPNLKRARAASIVSFCKSQEISDRYQLVEVDLRDSNEVINVLKEFSPNAVCHLAAQAGVRHSIDDPHSYIDNNITATLNLLEACKETSVSDFILASTSSVYGLTKDMPFSEDTPISTTISTYSASKRACELLCYTYHDLYNIRFRILRFFTVYGPWGRPDMAIFKFTKSIIEGKAIDVYNFGKMKRDFTYVEDIVSGFYAAIKSNLDYEIINLGCGDEPVELSHFIETIENTLSKKAKKNLLPIQSGDVPASWADISKAKNLLNYDPETRIEVGIPNFIKWYLDYYNIDY